MIHKEALRELALRELARRDLKSFLKLKWERFNQMPFLDNWHFDYLCKILQSTLPKFSKNEPLTRLMLNMPPSYGKTETIARTFIPWALGNEPTRKFIYISYSDDLGRKINKQIRELMKSTFYSLIFGKCEFIQENSSEFILRQGGGLFVTTLKAALTGFHADSILIDDPIKVENMKSKKEREFVNQAFKDSVLTRLQDTKSNITILMQRLGDDDLCGFLLNERHFSREIIEKWKHLKIEALNKEATLYKVGDFEYKRVENEPLFLKKHDLEHLNQLKIQMGEDEFSTQYQQEPQASEAGYFELEYFKIIPSYEMKNQNEYIFFDNATALNARADNRALVVVGVENDNESVRYVVKNCFYGIWDEMQTCEHIIETLLAYPQAKCYIEAEGGGQILHRLLQREIVRVNENLKRQNKEIIKNVIEVYPASRKISKVEKIKAMRAYYNTGALVFIQKIKNLFSKTSLKESFEEDEELHRIKKAYTKTELPDKHHYIFGRVVSYKNFKELTNKTKNAKQVMIKLVGNMGAKRLVNALNYAIENSELTYAINERGDKVSLEEIYNDWRPTFSSRENAKEAWHLVFSLDEKILTQKQQKAFMDSVKETMDMNFFGHKYAMVLHKHQSRPHLHVILNKYNFIEHKRLHFKQKGEIKNFFKNLRDDFSHSLGLRGLNYINKNPLEKNLEEELAKTNKMDRILKSDSQFGISMIYEDLQKTLNEKIKNKEERIKALRVEYEELNQKFDELDKLLQQYILHKNKRVFSLYKQMKELGRQRRAITQKIFKEIKEKRRLDSSMMNSKENYKNHCLERLESVSYKRKFLQSYEKIYPRHKGASKKDIQNYYRVKKALKNEGVELTNELKLYSKNYYTEHTFEETNLFQLEKKFKVLDENIYILKNADYFLREQSKEYVSDLEKNLNYLKKIYDTRFNKIEKELLEKAKKNPFLIKEYARACEYLKVENKIEKLLRTSASSQSENTSFKNERKPRNLYQEIQDKYRNPAKKQEQNNQGQSQESYRGFSR